MAPTIQFNIKMQAAALRRVNRELNEQLRYLAYLDARLDPAKLQRRVTQRLYKEEYHRELAFDENKERAKQLGKGRAFMDLFNIPDLSKKFAGVGGKLAGLGETVGGGVGAMLGKAGAALAIPGVGLALSAAAIAIPVLTNALKQLAAAPFATINAGLKGLLGPLGPIGAALNISTGFLDKFVSSVKKIPIVGPLLALGPEILSQTLKQLGQFLQLAQSLVAKARPGEIRRLQFALDDTAAVVGHRLTPIIETLRDAIRGMGDILQTILPSTQEFREAFAPLRDTFREMKTLLAPVIRLLKIEFAQGLRVIGLILRQQARFMEFLNRANVLGPILERIFGPLNLESSIGAAARQVQITNPESYAKEVYAAAAGSGADPAQRTAENTGQTTRLLEQIRDILATRGAAAGVETRIGRAANGVAAAAAEASRGNWLNIVPAAIGGLIGG